MYIYSNRKKPDRTGLDHSHKNKQNFKKGNTKNRNYITFIRLIIIKMDRNSHKKHIPECPRVGASSLPDQYMWKDKDTNAYRCFNGISHPIYDCKGEINYSLPLEQYPRVGEVHPQIAMTRRMHLNWRGEPDKRVFVHERFNFEDKGSTRTEGFYTKRQPYQRFSTRGVSSGNPHLELVSDMVPGYPLPSPYADTKSGSCYSCQ